MFICFNEGSLKMMKNYIYFTLKALFDLKIFKLLSELFGFIVKQLDKKAKVNFKNYDATDWTKNNCIIYNVQYFKK